MDYKILSVNPDSTSTKFAVYENKYELFRVTIVHPKSKLEACGHVIEQLDMRKSEILKVLEERKFSLTELNAVVGRGGHLPPPRESGAYMVNALMCARLKDGFASEHAANLGALIAKEIADTIGIPAYIYDPVEADEVVGIAKISESSAVRRPQFSHCLNSRAVAIKAAKARNCRYENMNIIVQHLGAGVSTDLQIRGHIVEIIGDDEDSLSPGPGGPVDVWDVEKRIDEADTEASLIYEARAYQCVKSIGALAAAARGEIDLIILTGDNAHSRRFTALIEARVSFIAPVAVMPGEDEMEALAFGGLRVLTGEESSREYTE